MQYDEPDILRVCGPHSLKAGHYYFQDRRVLTFSRQGETVTASVLGNQRRAYTQTIAIRSGAGGIVIEGKCTCPVGRNCKHVAAALLHGLTTRAAGEAPAAPTPEQRVDRLLPRERQPHAADSPPESLPAALVSWLDDLVGSHLVDAEAFPKGVIYRIVYVVVPQPVGQATPRLGVLPMSVRLLKDGSFARNGKPYDITATLAGNVAAFLRPSDRKILRALAAANRYHQSYSAQTLAVEGGREILADIMATGRARWLDVNGPALASGPARPGRTSWQPIDAAMTPRLDVEGGAIVLNAEPPVYVDVAQGLIGPIETGFEPAVIAALLRAPAVPADKIASLNASLHTRAPGLAALAPPEPRTERLTGLPARPILRLVMADLPIPNSPYRGFSLAYLPKERRPLASLAFRYGPVVAGLGDPRAVVPRLVEGRLVEVERDPASERQAAVTLMSHGFAPAPDRRANVPPEHARDFLPEGDESVWLLVLYDIVPRLEADGWAIEIAEDFPIRMLRATGAVEASLQEGTGIDWLELDLGIMVDGERIDLIDPIAALLSTSSVDLERVRDRPLFAVLADGRVLGIPAERLLPIVAAIRDLATGTEQRGGRLRLNRAEAGLLADFEAAAGQDVVWRGGERLRQMGAKLNATGGIPAVTLPADFRATLRPYQAEGLAWLAFLRDVGLGGILADDMGLGKTVQALGLLAVEKAAGRLDRPALVVAPTSLMGNWRREAERFAPDLRVLTLQGQDRKSRFDQIAVSDLVLTTYPLIARDHAVLAAQDWHVMILDEAQTIKNPEAATTRLLFSINAAHRFCLTGTPLENHLGELWSLFSFACPGLLGDRRSFNRLWRTPIEKQADRERSRLLARRIKPFLLRRTKDEVARDLPPKTEIVERIELPQAQRDLYESIRLSMHARVRAAIADKGWSRSRIVILDALLKLRQVCCDPRLLKTKLKGADAGSAKLERLEEMLAELLAEGRRVIVFSQFTSMLDLIRPRLDAARVPYALLTGDTRHRDAAIESFDSGAARVFLISLRAGGTGLNLVSADTIVLYDPWWNPAVEEQAIDRAHRIGQDKPVFVHKLVAIGTIEEKMESLKEKKSALAQSLFDHDSAPTLAMTEADLDMLFET